MKVAQHMILLLIVIAVMGCQQNLTKDISDLETERANAFMSGKIMINSTWQTPPMPRNLIAHDYSAGTEFPSALIGSSHGSSYLWEMANTEFIPDQWSTHWGKERKTIETIEQQDLSSASTLLNLEMVAFTLIKYFLTKTDVNGEMVDASTYLLNLLLEHETRGELDLLAENLMKIRPHLSKDKFDLFASMISQQANSNLIRIEEGSDVSEPFQWKRKKSLQAIAILDGRELSSLQYVPSPKELQINKF